MTTIAHTMPPVSRDNLDDIVALICAVAWPHRRADIDMLLRLGHGRVVRDETDGTPVGVGLWWAFGDALARLGLIIVAPRRQGDGIGRALLQRLLADTADRSTMLLATESGLPLYESLGFVTVGACRQYQGEYLGRRGSDPRIRAPTPANLPAIADLDAKAFGARRDTVLDALLQVGRIAVLFQDKRLVGYAVERPFGRGSVIGPVVASSEDDAVALFQALARPGFVRVDAPVAATGFGEHLSACGLDPLAGDSPVMVRGAPPSPPGPQRILALSSHALG